MNSKKLNVIVVEDNKVFNRLLSQSLLKHLQNRKYLVRNSDVKLYSFTDPDDCMKHISSDKNIGRSIAFLDYYLGKGTNAMQLLNCFKEKNNEIKFVVLSQSDQIVNTLLLDEQMNVDGHVIKKDIYTPDICCILLEDFIQKNSP
jgi:hypothetical protein